jgi:predicted signal transduction protein with EAL and GGDEF domain
VSAGAWARFSVSVLGAVMLLGIWRSPEVFDMRIEVIHFLLCAGALSAIAMLAGQLSQIRHRLQVQKLELRAALDRLQQLATHDELTGLPNRRQVMALLSHEERRALRQEQPMCVALLDIDHFKSVNDNLGHQAGDETLRRFARRSFCRPCAPVMCWHAGVARSSSWCCRYAPGRGGTVLERLRAALCRPSPAGRTGRNCWSASRPACRRMWLANPPSW